MSEEKRTHKGDIAGERVVANYKVAGSGDCLVIVSCLLDMEVMIAGSGLTMPKANAPERTLSRTIPPVDWLFSKRLYPGQPRQMLAGNQVDVLIEPYFWTDGLWGQQAPRSHSIPEQRPTYNANLDHCGCIVGTQ